MNGEAVSFSQKASPCGLIRPNPGPGNLPKRLSYSMPGFFETGSLQRSVTWAVKISDNISDSEFGLGDR
jgi:hypothetical protein